MKYRIKILLALLLLCGTTEIHQFLKIPLLFSHFQHHKTSTPGLSLRDFLQLHYSNQEHPNDNDDQEDEELPFRSAGTIAHIDPFQPVLKEIQIITALPFQQSAYALYPEGSPLHIAFAIFHPPQSEPISLNGI